MALYLFSDPTIYVSNDIELGWYAGTNKTGFLKVIPDLIMRIGDKIGVYYSHIYNYGSSGAGFASINLAHSVAASSNIAINPQTCICIY